MGPCVSPWEGCENKGHTVVQGRDPGGSLGFSSPAVKCYVAAGGDKTTGTNREWSLSSFLTNTAHSTAQTPDTWHQLLQASYFAIKNAATTQKLNSTPASYCVTLVSYLLFIHIL